MAKEKNKKETVKVSFNYHIKSKITKTIEKEVLTFIKKEMGISLNKLNCNFNIKSTDILIAKNKNDETVGVAIISTRGYGNTTRLMYLCVHQDYRNMSIGSQIIKEISRNHQNDISLSTPVYYQNALHFYKKHKFINVELSCMYPYSDFRKWGFELVKPIDRVTKKTHNTSSLSKINLDSLKAVTSFIKDKELVNYFSEIYKKCDDNI